MCVCVCVCARARARVSVSVSVCVCVPISVRGEGIWGVGFRWVVGGGSPVKNEGKVEGGGGGGVGTGKGTGKSMHTCVVKTTLYPQCLPGSRVSGQGVFSVFFMEIPGLAILGLCSCSRPELSQIHHVIFCGQNLAKKTPEMITSHDILSL